MISHPETSLGVGTSVAPYPNYQQRSASGEPEPFASLQFLRALLAPAIVRTPRVAFCAIAALIGLRFLLAAWLPLSFDEAYYWLWSKHLALGYYDHPALIAFAIRAGTSLFGETQFGVRAVPLVASILASWAVWQAAVLALADERAGVIACLFFNTTLMVAAETMAATPDSLEITAATLLLWALARLITSRNARWWLAVGAFAGLALSAKYVGALLCAGVVLWVVANRENRGWLRSPWPYAGALVALLLFAPTIYWNLTHEMISFRFQLGRIDRSHFSFSDPLEFVAASGALISPFIAVMAGIGLARNSVISCPCRRLVFAAASIWPALIYFALHSLHDRVQGNWPSFLVPAAALLAAQVFVQESGHGWTAVFLKLARRLAIPTAAVILLVAYAQAFFGIVPIGRRDPIARTTAVGFLPVADAVARLAREQHAGAIVTTNYPVTAWLSFYRPFPLPVIQITDDFRYLSSPRATPSMMRRPLIYVAQEPDRELMAVRAHFTTIVPVRQISRMRNGTPIDSFDVYELSGFRGGTTGRTP